MAEARDRAAWNRTMALLAQLYNAHRARGAKSIDPMQFFPWHNPEPQPQRAPPPTPEQRAWLRANFGRKRPKPES